MYGTDAKKKPQEKLTGHDRKFDIMDSNKWLLCQLKRTKITTNAKCDTQIDYEKKFIYQNWIKYNHTCK